MVEGDRNNDISVPLYRERGPDFELFTDMTRKLNEKNCLIRAQSAEIISKSDEALRYEARIAILLDHCPIGVIFACNRIVEYVNQRITDITGYSKDELVGKNTLFLYDTLGEWDDVGKLQVSGGRTIEVDVKLKPKEGPSVPCKLQMTRVIDAFDHEFLVLVYADI